MKTEIAFFAAGYISATFITLFIVFQYLRYKEQPDEVVEKPKQQNEQTQFEVGKVYKKRDSLIIFYCTEINDLEAIGFGITYDGSWLETAKFASHSRIHQFTEATEDEWLKRLTEEANKRGFKRGVRYKSTKYFSYANEVCKGTKLRLNANGMGMQTLCEAGNTFIMQDGKWAEIIE